MLRITPQLNPDTAKRYQAEHLSVGDYYLSESENYGHWLGKGSQMLGLEEGSIISKTDYDRLCENQRPSDGEKLTMRNKSNRRVAYDFTFSVPKDISVLAYTTNDRRIIDAFHESCRYTMGEVEKDACVRIRKKGADEDRSSGNLIIAEFRHDTSRPVGLNVPDPHLHAHYLVFNASFDPLEKQFKAVQFGELKTDASYYQEIQINRFVQSLHRIGYKVVASKNGFYRLAGLPDSVTNNFSKRSNHIEEEISRRGLVKGSKLAKEVTLETRQNKIKGLSRDDLVKQWKAAISPDDWAAIEKVRASANAPVEEEGIVLENIITEGTSHCFERRSVVRDKQILAAALKMGRGEVDLEALKQELIIRQEDGRLLRDGRELTTPETLGSERLYVTWSMKGKNKHGTLGKMLTLPNHFSQDQLRAVQSVLNSRDTVTAVIGDAGTGKTTIMPEIIRGIEAAGGSVYACAPSTGAKAVLQNKVTSDADTLQMLLASPKLQESIKGKVILVDEAGFVSSKQMCDLALLAERNRNRLILVGDPKQHTSIEAGDAFRAMIRYGELPVCRIQEIQRQKDPVYRDAVWEWAQGNVRKALEHFESREALIEIKDYRKLLDRAAEDYVQSTLKGMQCLAISPVWSEINDFSDVVRHKLKEALQLERDEIQIDTVDSYSWTEAERRNIRNYSAGDAITFHRASEGFERHEVVKVLKRQNDFLQVQRQTGEPALFNPSVKSAFDVGTIVEIAVARREKLLIQGNLLQSKLVNGEIVEVKDFHSDGTLKLTDGRIIPATYRQFTYGYANTSHTSQGKTVDRGILILGHDAIEAAGLRQGYVSNSRFQYTQAIYTTDLEAAKEALAMRKERKLAHDLNLREKGSARKPAQRPEMTVQKEKQRWHFGLKM